MLIPKPSVYLQPIKTRGRDFIDIDIKETTDSIYCHLHKPCPVQDHDSLYSRRTRSRPVTDDLMFLFKKRVGVSLYGSLGTTEKFFVFVKFLVISFPLGLLRHKD